MKKLVLLLSVVAVSFALQAGDGACTKDKAACAKSKTVAGEKAKDGVCAKGASEAQGSCPAAKKAEEAAKQPAPTSKQPS